MDSSSNNEQPSQPHQKQAKKSASTSVASRTDSDSTQSPTTRLDSLSSNNSLEEVHYSSAHSPNSKDVHVPDLALESDPVVVSDMSISGKHWGDASDDVDDHSVADKSNQVVSTSRKKKHRKKSAQNITTYNTRSKNNSGCVPFSILL